MHEEGGGADATELLLSSTAPPGTVGRQQISRLADPETKGSEHSGDVWVIGTGADIVVMQRRGPDATGVVDSLSLWVGTAE